MLHKHTFAIILLLKVTTLYSELTLSKSLSDNMVFQSHQPIMIWGTADPEQSISVTFEKETQTTTSSKKGDWNVILNARSPNSTNQNILIQSNQQKIILKNILIGEVWFCAGQSNMAMRIPKTIDEQKAKQYQNNHQIRFLAMNKKPYTKPFQKELPDGYSPTKQNIQNFYEFSTWSSCEENNISKLSAVAYWFAHHLNKELNIPIGLIVPPLGGSAAQAWVSRKSFENNQELSPLLEQWIQDEPIRLQKQFRTWLDANLNAEFDQTPLHRHRPTTLFEAAVQPMQHHQIRGVIWYQGEQNAGDSIQREWFRKCFPKLIEDFRNNWKQPKLPFYHTQLPGFGNEEWPAFRELQRSFQHIPHTGMAVTIDLGLEKNIHPKDKSPIGKRLANLALKREYKKPHIQDCGPQLLSMSYEGDNLHLNFDNSLNLQHNSLPHFELAGDDQHFYSVKAKAEGQKVILENHSYNKPKYIRYAWSGYPRPILLISNQGLPTGPFLLDVP
jgi:sialate O-acetylesterase